MRARTVFAILTAVLAGAFAHGEDVKPLTIGDKTPALPLDGVIKGKNLESFEAGKTYVIEFWATWCGPCIASMPHLSELAEKYQGKAEFYSVNTWDYAKTAAGADGKPGVEAVDTHKQRVKDWVAKNEDKMRYNVVFDDAKDTISTTWMRAAGRNGIPCAFIVNGEGQIAWIGHPMSMEEPLKKITEGSWDLQGFKEQFDTEAAAAKARADAQKKLVSDLKSNNYYAVGDYVAGSKSQADAIAMVITSGISSNVDLSLAYYKANIGKVEGLDATDWSYFASILIPRMLSQTTKDDLVRLSEQNLGSADDKVKALAYTYHARAVFLSGNKDGALAWIEKAKGALGTYPEQGRASISNYIDTTAASFKK